MLRTYDAMLAIAKLIVFRYSTGIEVILSTSSSAVKHACSSFDRLQEYVTIFKSSTEVSGEMRLSLHLPHQECAYYVCRLKSTPSLVYVG